MLDRDAKPKTANRIDVGYIPIERIDNMAGALFGDSTVQRKYVVKLSFIITAARPANIGQVNIIGNAEILKWSEQLALDRLRQSDFRCNAAIEVIQNVFSIHAFRRCGQTQ